MTDEISPENRASGMWSGDSRMIARGRGCDVVLHKQGKKPYDDLSQVEAVQMGHVMEPVVAHIFEDVHGVKLKALDDTALTHRQHPWMKSHFDYVSTDGTYLVECKNYNEGAKSKFSEAGEAIRIPPADMYQCIHEAAVYGVNKVWLAVLFGGQSYRDYEIDVTEEMKDGLIQNIAIYWAHVQNGSLPEPSTVDQARFIYPSDAGRQIVATAAVEQMCSQLKAVKKQIKQLEEAEESMTGQLMAWMKDHSEVVSVDGSTILTWKQAKGSKKFSASLFQQSMPDIYAKFVVEVPGSRRFLVK